MDTDLFKSITDNYDISPIVSVKPTKNGSGNTFYIETNDGVYIAKLNERIDFVSLYDKIQPILSEQGFLQSKVIRTKKNKLMASELFVLYSFLSGANSNSLNKQQILNAVKYMKFYNSTLASIPFSPLELKVDNHWDKANSLNFIINDFQYSIFELGSQNNNVLSDAIQILRGSLPILCDSKKQLVHSDLGPDNFLFTGNDVLSIIDFTPSYEHEFYSLCQFCYWVFLWTDTASKTILDDLLKVYNLTDVSKNDMSIFYTLLIKASLFRVVGMLLSNTEINIPNANKRIKILENTVLLYKSER